MLNNFNTIGDRIAVRKIKQENKEVNGMVVPFKGEKSGNVWGEIIALPEVTENIWIKTLKIGDKVLFKEFESDQVVSVDGEDDFQIIEIQPNGAMVKGQVWAVQK
jgi:co-chaperonin GroES (HSP10)